VSPEGRGAGCLWGCWARAARCAGAGGARGGKRRAMVTAEQQQPVSEP
jgi:hypothetical protein